MAAIELKLNMILSKNPNLINSLNRSHVHPLIRKYSRTRYYILIYYNFSFYMELQPLD